MGSEVYRRDAAVTTMRRYGIDFTDDGKWHVHAPVTEVEAVALADIADSCRSLLAALEEALLDYDQADAPPTGHQIVRLRPEESR